MDHFATEPPSTYRVLGVRVNAVQIPGAVALMERWVQEHSNGNYVAVTGMHGVMEAQRDLAFKEILDHASLVVPDGMPLVWVGRWRHFQMPRRVYGPELMETFCRMTGNRYKHFFYGGASGVADELARVMQEKYGIRIAGSFCPPFRHLKQEEEQELLKIIAKASPDVLWVGLSTPKQEAWMAEYRDRLDVPVLVGVGAAFDFCTGRSKQAPRWMQEHGLEWLFRLSTEPRRLWRRYLLNGPRFAWNVGLDLCGWKKF